MPKLYEYFGLIILFYSNEHEPIHVHGKFQGTELKAEIIFENGNFVSIEIKEVAGKNPLPIKERRNFIKLVSSYKDDIVKKWIDFFVYNVPVKSEKITSRLK